MFDKILIANRGEIACRIMHTARDMGIASVAVYSDADEHALHVTTADEAVRIGPAAALESYLKIENIINAALETGAQAIHPGYGFLSENPEFVEAVEKAGLVFIGPSASAIRAMGLKDAAKVLMVESGVPVVPGYHGENQDADFLAAEADKIGYPVLIKARAGGGGKGMRLVEDAAGFSAALEGAAREGLASFGDGHVLIEKFITSPRHIEIQVFGDNHGNVVHLFERDCSLQRRHQKVIEEAPAPGMNEEMRAIMGEAAVKAAKAVNYSGAGTVEFIVDGSDGLKPDGFWFMEMNTRLQVEHPVTEMITGLDLVGLQLHVANGERLHIAQNDLKIDGWAFEARLYAEDPTNGFLPSVGKLECFLMPEEQARIDSGAYWYGEVSPHYDPMIGKIIVHGATREEALQRLDEALKETYVAGVVTNTAFLSSLCRNEDFASGRVDTGLIERDMASLMADGEVGDIEMSIAALVATGDFWNNDDLEENSEFQNWRQWDDGKSYVDLMHKDQLISCSISKIGHDVYRVGVGGAGVLELRLKPAENKPADFIQVDWDGGSRVVTALGIGQELVVIGDGKAHAFTVIDPLENNLSEGVDLDSIVAPMPGLIKVANVKSGEKVTEGQVLLVLEAMKMEHSLVAPRDGVVEALHVATGDQISDSALLLTLEPESDKPE